MRFTPLALSLFMIPLSFAPAPKAPVSKAPKKKWVVEGSTPQRASEIYRRSAEALSTTLQDELFRETGATGKTRKARLQAVQAYYRKSCKRIVLMKGKKKMGGFKTDVSKQIAEDLVRVLNKAMAQGYTPTTIGGIAVRSIRGNRKKLSKHAWGLAIDLDAANNGQKTSVNGKKHRSNSKNAKEAYEKVKRDTGCQISWETVNLFLDEGFTWGGFFRASDPMHFEK